MGLELGRGLFEHLQTMTAAMVRYSFVQLRSSVSQHQQSHSKSRGDEVISIVKAVAEKQHSASLAQLASRMATVMKYAATAGNLDYHLPHPRREASLSLQNIGLPHDQETLPTEEHDLDSQIRLFLQKLGSYVLFEEEDIPLSQKLWATKSF